jgi:16S rRNA (cytosine1402-N4)-methyltransferase
VNDELGQLDRLLAALPELLTPGGRAVLISFHSLEDRRVKLALRDHRGAGRISDAAKHPIIASDTESAANPRSASAKLRWAVR